MPAGLLGARQKAVAGTTAPPLAAASIIIIIIISFALVVKEMIQDRDLYVHAAGSHLSMGET